MNTYSIFDFYNFVEKVAICYTFILGVILFFASLAFINYGTTKSEKIFCIKIFCIVVAFLFCTGLFFIIFLNYLQIR